MKAAALSTSDLALVPKQNVRIHSMPRYFCEGTSFVVLCYLEPLLSMLYSQAGADLYVRL
jgi:hypothetical protein